MTEIYESNGTLNSQFMWSYFKYREVPYKLKLGAALSIPPARSTIYGTKSVHFCDSLIWNRLNLAGQYLNLRILSRKWEILSVGVWDVEGSTLWANIHVSLVIYCVVLDHLDTSHLALYCSQLAGCYMTSKNCENVVHFGYWLKVYHFLYHFVCHFFFYKLLLCKLYKDDLRVIWANFRVVLVIFCIVFDHVDTSHLALYCSELTGCYMICKNGENVVHLGYWPRVCHFLCHVCDFFFYIILIF